MYPGLKLVESYFEDMNERLTRQGLKVQYDHVKKIIECYGPLYQRQPKGQEELETHVSLGQFYKGCHFEL